MHRWSADHPDHHVAPPLLATITLAGGKVEQLKDVVFGCSSSHDGQSFRLADGVLSLEKANISFASRAAACFLGSFFYCLNFVLVQ